MAEQIVVSTGKVNLQQRDSWEPLPLANQPRCFQECYAFVQSVSAGRCSYERKANTGSQHEGISARGPVPRLEPLFRPRTLWMKIYSGPPEEPWKIPKSCTVTLFPSLLKRKLRPFTKKLCTERKETIRLPGICWRLKDLCCLSLKVGAYGDRVINGFWVKVWLTVSPVLIPELILWFIVQFRLYNRNTNN